MNELFENEEYITACNYNQPPVGVRGGVYRTAAGEKIEYILRRPGNHRPGGPAAEGVERGCGVP